MESPVQYRLRPKLKPKSEYISRTGKQKRGLHKTELLFQALFASVSSKTRGLQKLKVQPFVQILMKNVDICTLHIL
jgi:hypothetical protein